jgi:hypothetical protein
MFFFTTWFFIYLNCSLPMCQICERLFWLVERRQLSQYVASFPFHFEAYAHNAIGVIIGNFREWSPAQYRTFIDLLVQLRIICIWKKKRGNFFEMVLLQVEDIDEV